MAVTVTFPAPVSVTVVPDTVAGPLTLSVIAPGEVDVGETVTVALVEYVCAPMLTGEIVGATVAFVEIITVFVTGEAFA